MNHIIKISHVLVLLIGFFGISSAVNATQSLNMVQVTCLENLGQLEIRQVKYRGDMVFNSMRDPSMSDRLFEDHGLIVDGSDEIITGTCEIGKQTLTWSYEDITEPGTGMCGAAYWGGYITLKVDEELFLDHVQIGGDLGGCPGAILQDISMNYGNDRGLEVHLKGYWKQKEKSKQLALSFPLSDEALNQAFPFCTFDNLRYSLEDHMACSSKQTIYLFRHDNAEKNSNDQYTYQVYMR